MRFGLHLGYFKKVSTTPEDKKINICIPFNSAAVPLYLAAIIINRYNNTNKYI